MQALGMIETRGILAAIEAADTMLKTANVTLFGKQKVGGGRVMVIVTGDVGAVKAAVEAGTIATKNINTECLLSHHVIPRPQDDLKVLFDLENNDLEKQEKSENFTEVKNKNQVIIEAEIVVEHVHHNMLTCWGKEAKTETTIDEAKMDIETENRNEIVIEDGSVLTEPENKTMIEVNKLQNTEKVPEIEEIEKDKFSSLEKINKDTLNQMVEEKGISMSMKQLENLKVTELRTLAKEYTDLNIKADKIAKSNKEFLVKAIRNYYETGEVESGKV